MSPVLPSSIDTLANLAGVAAVIGATLGVLIAEVIDTVRELRGHRRLRRQLDAFLEQLAGIEGTDR